jgi:hypoxanthine phosphoribosyltransferase
MRLSDNPVISATRIEKRVAELAKEISCEYKGRKIVLIVVLKGAVLFAADLVRKIEIPLEIEFLRAKSYDCDKSTGNVGFTVYPEIDLAGRDVLVVEDILDTGRTASATLERIRRANPASVALCVLLDKPIRRIVPVTPDYVGFEVDDLFVVGYGLDYNERWRGLSEIYVAEED